MPSNMIEFDAAEKSIAAIDRYCNYDLNVTNYESLSYVKLLNILIIFLARKL